MTIPKTNFWIGAWEGGWALLPIVALFAGAWSFAPPFDTASAPQVAIAAALLLAGWLPLWRAITQTHWHTHLQAWREWEAEAPLPTWPYLQAQTPGAALYHALGRARSWWQHLGANALSLPLRTCLLTLLVSLLLSLALGRTALLLSLLFLTWAQLTALWNEGHATVGSLAEATALAGLPWLLGATLGESSSPLALLSTLSIILLVGLHTRAALTAILGPVFAGLFLLWQGHPLATGGLLLLAFPGLRYAAHQVSQERYREAVAPWLLAMLLLIAGVL